MHTLFTWGYSKRTLADLLAVVAQYGCFVIDVRRSTASVHKPEFSKLSLTKALLRQTPEGKQQHGYWAMPRLGNQAKSLPWQRHDYWKEAVADVVKMLREQPVLLLCLEREATECHRLEVAQEVAKISECTVVHL